MSKRAVIYCRVSSRSQVETDYDPEGLSLPAQREACTRKAESLGAVVVEEFIDKGESAKTADRPALQAMLAYLKQDGVVDAVVVHKVDRLARNRADDVAIMAEIRAAGTQLISVSENVDETPSGFLLHGILSSVAEFYSRNLAHEIMKGTSQKAKNGGTLGRAPIGYENVREMVDGREVRTIAIDPERAPLVRAAFELYAKGSYALAELAQVMEDRGLTSRPTRKAPAKPLGKNRLQELLRNDYYVGVVHYDGKTYVGRHPKLVSVSTYERVQTLLDSRRLSGERQRVNRHYLKGTLYCDADGCGERLWFSRNRGHGGVYDYFLCAGRHAGTCSQPYHRAERIEHAVERYYRESKLLSKEHVEKVRQAMRERVRVLTSFAKPELERAERTLTRLLDEERKLLRQHYADHISEELFVEEQARMRLERAAAEQTVAALSANFDRLLKNLDIALELADNVGKAYAHAGPSTRRLLNQALFDQILIRDEEVVGVALAEPFKQLLVTDEQAADAPDRFAQQAFGADKVLVGAGFGYGPLSSTFGKCLHAPALGARRAASIVGDRAPSQAPVLESATTAVDCCRFVAIDGRSAPTPRAVVADVLRRRPEQRRTKAPARGTAKRGPNAIPNRRAVRARPHRARRHR